MKHTHSGYCLTECRRQRPTDGYALALVAVVLCALAVVAHHVVSMAL